MQAFAGILPRAREEGVDPIADIELPMKVSAIGIPIVGAVIAAAHFIFGVHVALGLLAIPLVFVFTLIAVNSTGLTSITPGGAIAKMTQLTFSAVAHGNTATNIMTAGITSDVTLSASNLLMDIKPGYMLGAKPRQQAVGHVLGVFAGAFVAVPVFYALFRGNISVFTSEAMPMPSAPIWRSVAELLTTATTLHFTARVAMAIAQVGVLIEIANCAGAGASDLGVGWAWGSSCVQYLRDRDRRPDFGWRAQLARPLTTDLRRQSEILCAGIIAGDRSRASSDAGDAGPALAARRVPTRNRRLGGDGLRPAPPASRGTARQDLGHHLAVVQGQEGYMPRP